ncbi:zinc finger protein 605 isoform X3 [Papio anubis]|uniref:zinc finger protein 605 isoform X3 n=1 Tax=Papio anubis TaxID=9555 RepID=UPI00083F43CD|nr:zinc finger protein 605 isoform X3 [Papio anubis]
MEVPVDLGCSAGGARGREAALGPRGEGPLGGRVEDVSAAIRTLLINDVDALWCQARATPVPASCALQVWMPLAVHRGVPEREVTWELPLSNSQPASGACELTFPSGYQLLPHIVWRQ